MRVLSCYMCIKAQTHVTSPD